jgi:expansin (peptidoglycan-binding protein)
LRRLLLTILILSACGGAGSNPAGPGQSGPSTDEGSTAGGGASRYFGESHTGNFWLGPVEYTGGLHNACASSNGENDYPAGVQDLYGDDIMGLAGAPSGDVVLQGLAASAGALCDVCAELSANGRTLVAHVVTYGVETGVDDIDVSPQILSALGSTPVYGGTWRFVTCPTTAPVTYTFDLTSHESYFRVWVRNARVPVAEVEYRVGAGDWISAVRENDGAWKAWGEDFSAGFSLRVTSIDGQTLEDDMPGTGIGAFDPSVGVRSHGNFQ